AERRLNRHRPYRNRDECDRRRRAKDRVGEKRFLRRRRAAPPGRTPPPPGFPQKERVQGEPHPEVGSREEAQHEEPAVKGKLRDGTEKRAEIAPHGEAGAKSGEDAAQEALEQANFLL